MSKTWNWRSSILYAIIGAILATAVDLLIRQPKSIDQVSYSSILASTAVGAVLGWMFDLARVMQDALDEALRRLDHTSRALDYQSDALTILLKDKTHTMVLNKLIADSIQEKFHHIPFVSINEFHNYLKLAIDQSSRFEGTQNKTVRWYKENQSGDYLRKIQQRQMELKRRIFVINDVDKEQMEADLRDYATMKYYWDNNGEIETYWILESSLRRNYPDVGLNSWDFGIYDNQLFIQYDEEHLVVTFDVMDENSNAKRIFAHLQTQIDQERDRPFIKIESRDLEMLPKPSPPAGRS